jgi:hypothetical protein
MLIKVPAKTNAQRQRDFRKRNPGYYGRLHARKRAATKASAAILILKYHAIARGAVPEPEVTLALTAATAAKPMLCLPAPAVVFSVLPTREEIAARAEHSEMQAAAAGSANGGC